jgi:hypothetical protein
MIRKGYSFYNFHKLEPCHSIACRFFCPGGGCNPLATPAPHPAERLILAFRTSFLALRLSFLTHDHPIPAQDACPLSEKLRYRRWAGAYRRAV